MKYIIIIIGIGFIIDIVFIVCDYKKYYKAAVVLKGLASLAFVVLGALCMEDVTNESFSMLVLSGLILGTIGDVFLNLRFVFSNHEDMHLKLGAGAFFLGHIVYIIATITACFKTMIVALPLALVMVPAVIIPYRKKIQVDKGREIIGIVYFVVMVSTFCFGVGMLIESGLAVFSIVFAVGGLIFMISDILYILTQFGIVKKNWYNGANLSTYYIAQMLIAVSILWA